MDKEMLCLAALTYRGFSSALPRPLQGERLGELIEEGIRDLTPPLEGRWQLAWGPMTYRASSSLFDDAMMFVAHDADADRYAIAVRGTNPVSGFDWLFGDLWVSEQVPWAGDPNEGGAAISLSTALGLHVLQTARSEPCRRWIERLAMDGRAFERALHSAAEVGARFRDLIAAIPAAFAGVKKSLVELAEARVQRSGAARLDELAATWRTSSTIELLRAVDEARTRGRRLPHLALFGMMTDEVGARGGLANGQTLLDFLKAAVAASPDPVEIAVTGHSKGGAVAPALALWLAETQGTQAIEEQEWDPKRRATVSCWAFAGPSPGNAAFADRFARAFDGRFHAIVNPRDLVPHAWESRTLAKLPDLYDGSAPCNPPLSTLIEAIRERMAAMEKEDRGYAHLRCDPVDWNWQAYEGDDDFLAHVIHHHLDGYFVAAGLELRLADFFDPLAPTMRPGVRQIRATRGRAVEEGIRRLAFPGLLTLLAKPEGSTPRADLGVIAARVAADDAPAREVERELGALLFGGAPVGTALRDDAVRSRVLRRALEELGRGYGIAITPDEAARVLELLASGGLQRDLRHTLAASARALGTLPRSLLSDVASLPARLADLLDGERDDSPERLAEIFGGVLAFATPAATARSIAELLDPTNQTLRLAIVLYARSRGVRLTEEDLDRLRTELLVPGGPDLGKLLTDAVDRALAARGGDVAQLLEVLRTLRR